MPATILPPANEARPVPGTRVGSVASIILAQGRGVYLSRRHESGRWQGPGGKLEPGESALAAARRELREETGLDLPDDRFVGLGSLVYPWKSYTVHGFLVRLKAGESPRHTEPGKHSAWELVPVDQAATRRGVELLPVFLRRLAA